jgi:hypothetical protein
MVNVTVVGANDAPTAVATATVQETGPQTIGVLANDTDPDSGDSKTVLAIDTGAPGGK